MKTSSPSSRRETRPAAIWPRAMGLLLAAGLFFSVVGPARGQPSTASAAEAKRLTDRYALTKSRIEALLALRLNPVPLPANPPNPFYQPSAETLATEPAVNQPDPSIPQAADETDIDTLRKYAATLRIGGIITLNDVLYLTVNNMTCKVGDIITVGNKDRPTYLKMLNLSPAEFTLGLNDATLSVPLRK